MPSEMGFPFLWCSAFLSIYTDKLLLACISLADVADIGTTVPVELGSSGTAMIEQLVFGHITSLM